MKVSQYLLISWFWKSSRAIRKSAPDSIPPGNPYRAILRRDYPEPLIALLAFILGIWLWDHYFGKEQGYAPGTEQVALVKIDRDLRLADAMADDPRWLKWLAGVSEPTAAREDALEVFQQLAAEQSISPQGLEAFAMVKAEQDGLPQGRSHGQGGIELRARAVFARSAVWLLGLVGLVFIPSALRSLKNGFTAKPRGYGDAWSLPLGLVVFLVATLAWIGFSMTLDLGIAALPGLHPGAAIFLDSAARLLPPLIALGLLFKRPSHAARVMGLARRVQMKAVLGMFSLLMIADQILRLAMGESGSNSPGGGLSLADSGLWGLAFALVSACLLAPVAEEILYRGVLFRACRNRLGVLPAALASSAVFALLHFYDGYGLASVAVFGFSCALLYAGTASLTTVIALHMLYNFAIKIPEWIVYHAPLGEPGNIPF